MNESQSLKDIWLEIAANRKTNIYGLADMIGMTNQQLYQSILKKSFSLKTLEKIASKLDLTDREIACIVRCKSVLQLEYENINQNKTE
jgi:DNA-binding Xre family transcriptional regulator